MSEELCQVPAWGTPEVVGIIFSLPSSAIVPRSALEVVIALRRNLSFTENNSNHAPERPTSMMYRKYTQRSPLPAPT
jgi:hypothetical protein